MIMKLALNASYIQYLLAGIPASMEKFLDNMILRLKWKTQIHPERPYKWDKLPQKV